MKQKKKTKTRNDMCKTRIQQYFITRIEQSCDKKK
jgi:hypothetical protein